MRGKMANSLKRTLAIQLNHTMLKLKKVWEYQDQTLMRDGRYTNEGFKKFWLSLDSAVEFWTKHLAPGGSRKAATFHPDIHRKEDFRNQAVSTSYQQQRPQHGYDRFHWKNKWTTHSARHNTQHPSSRKRLFLS